MNAPWEDGAPAGGAFEASSDGSRWTFTGALTFENAASVVAAARELALPTSGRVDLVGLDTADSSALAALFALQRLAGAERRRLVFENVPGSLISLAQVYGVAELLGTA